jgi:hypothetical protein
MCNKLADLVVQTAKIRNKLAAVVVQASQQADQPCSFSFRQVSCTITKSLCRILIFMLRLVCATVVETTAGILCCLHRTDVIPVMNVICAAMQCSHAILQIHASIAIFLFLFCQHGLIQNSIMGRNHRKLAAYWIKTTVRKIMLLNAFLLPGWPRFNIQATTRGSVSMTQQQGAGTIPWQGMRFSCILCTVFWIQCAASIPVISSNVNVSYGPLLMTKAQKSLGVFRGGRGALHG